MSVYRTIVADPPWAYRNARGTQTRSRRGRNAITAAGNYPTMAVAEIMALEVPAADEAHVFLWTTVPLMFDRPGPRDVLEAWGFEYLTTLTWVKTGPPGLGFHFRVETEHVLVGRCGGASIPAARRPSNVIVAPRRGHSVKPDAFYDVVERACDGPYLEMFARRQRLGWDTWGDEALGHVEIGGAA